MLDTTSAYSALTSLLAPKSPDSIVGGSGAACVRALHTCNWTATPRLGETNASQPLSSNLRVPLSVDGQAAASETQQALSAPSGSPPRLGGVAWASRQRSAVQAPAEECLARAREANREARAKAEAYFASRSKGANEADGCSNTDDDAWSRSAPVVSGAACVADECRARAPSIPTRSIAPSIPTRSLASDGTATMKCVYAAPPTCERRGGILLDSLENLREEHVRTRSALTESNRAFMEEMTDVVRGLVEEAKRGIIDELRRTREYTDAKEATREQSLDRTQVAPLMDEILQVKASMDARPVQVAIEGLVSAMQDNHAATVHVLEEIRSRAAPIGSAPLQTEENVADESESQRASGNMETLQESDKHPSVDVAETVSAVPASTCVSSLQKVEQQQVFKSEDIPDITSQELLDEIKGVNTGITLIMKAVHDNGAKVQSAMKDIRNASSSTRQEELLKNLEEAVSRIDAQSLIEEIRSVKTGIDFGPVLVEFRDLSKKSAAAAEENRHVDMLQASQLDDGGRNIAAVSGEQPLCEGNEAVGPEQEVMSSSGTRSLSDMRREVRSVLESNSGRLREIFRNISESTPCHAA